MPKPIDQAHSAEADSQKTQNIPPQDSAQSAPAPEEELQKNVLPKNPADQSPPAENSFMKKLESWIRVFKPLWNNATLIFTILIFLALLFPLLPELLPGSATYGNIWVDSPEVYTRERLVNDRFTQDAWLKKQLDKDIEYAGAQSYLNELINAQLTAQKNATTDKGKISSASESKAEPAATISSGDLFIDRFDYRDRVRNLKIENLLDDRHDLNGNTLYRLKFDATIIPGSSTHALAQIEVQLTGTDFNPPYTEKKKEQFLAFYRDWLVDLKTRLNETHQLRKNAYYNNEFGRKEYAGFRRYIAKYFYIDVNALPECLQEEQLSAMERTQQKFHTKEKECIRAIVQSSNFQLIGAGHNYKGTQSGDNDDFRYDQFSDNDHFLHNDQLASGWMGDNDDNEYGFALIQRSKAEGVDTLLHSYLHTSALKLVLGIQLDQMMNSHPVLTSLCRIIPMSTMDSVAFDVQETLLSIPAIDTKGCSKEKFDALQQKSESGLYAGLIFEDFSTPLFGGDNDHTIRILAEDAYWFNKYPGLSDFCQLTQGYASPQGIYSARCKTGLIQFLDHIRNQTKTYAYAVTPKMRSANEYTTLNYNMEAAGASMLNNLAARVGLAKRQRTVNRRGTTVGYGKASANNQETVLGWVISPQVTVGNNRKKIHAPSQQSLSALISLPSWWHRIHLTVSTNWLNQDNDNNKVKSEKNSYYVDLPTNYEHLEATMLEKQQRAPELMTTMLDPINLTACRPGAIVIPGERLWRSSVVTLGNQTADEISVLPNMKGIIARFNSVENQMSIAENKRGDQEKGVKDSGYEIKRKVRVWTSQGMTLLPELATISVSQTCLQKTLADIRQGNSQKSNTLQSHN